MHSKIGKYARPLNICFNGENKTISAYNDTVEFEFEEAGEYNLSVEQITDDNLGIISKIFLIILMCFDTIISLYNLESFKFTDYNGTKPYLLTKTYIIELNANTDISLEYKDTSYSASTLKFSIPNIKIKNFSTVNETTDLYSSAEPLKQNKKYLKITLSLICFFCFLGVSPIFYSALFSGDIAIIALCSAILLFIIAIYIIALLKITFIYNEIINKLSIDEYK